MVGRDLIHDVEAIFGAGGGDVVIDGGDVAVGTAKLAASHAEDRPVGAGDLVDEVEVDVEDRWFAIGLDDDVLLPDFFEQCFRCCAHGLAF